MPYINSTSYRKAQRSQKEPLKPQGRIRKHRETPESTADKAFGSVHDAGGKEEYRKHQKVECGPAEYRVKRRTCAHP